MAPRLLIGVGSAGSVSFACHWYQKMTTANTVKTSATSREEAVAAKFAAPEGFEEIERRDYDETEFIFLRRR